ncbi:hypothetical protein CBR_g41757 [Chara braunii]|uniref:V-type proton ATPase subunit n=1 Tax=Chara braunii TaxID=69332 RepID=A0A388LWJ2_CHABU|nr:hypothetical protein CBR_g41757 [Chara braunii]|eukprot:GBG86694.1 hypothetical protein CBR_g41757 [Chara braunii]
MSFAIGTLVFLIVSFVGSLGVRLFYNQNPATNLLNITLVNTAVVCCWLTWAIVYMAQMHPLVNPIRKAEGE